MNPDESDQPSLLKPDIGDQPAAAFSSGMPDPFARQSAEINETKQNSNIFEADRPNSVAAKTLGGYDKSTENVIPTSDYRSDQTNPPTNQAPENIYRIDSPADGNGQRNAANQAFPDQSQAPTSGQTSLSNQAFPAQNQTAIADHTPSANQNPVASNMTSASDYLNQIAPQKSGGSKFLSKKVLIIGGILAFVLLVTIIVVAVTNSTRQAPQQAAVSVGTELTNLQTLVAYGKSNNVGASNVVKVTAETNLITLSRQSDLGEVFTLTDKENPVGTPAFIADLDSAKANSNLESVYTDTLIGQLNTTYIALQNLDQQVATTDTKNALAQAMNDIKELYQRLEE